MDKIEVSLGNALFVVDVAPPKLKKSKTWHTTTHFHADLEVHAVLNGNATIEISNEDVVINQGEICLLAPNLSHYPKACSEHLEKTNFSFNISQNYARFGKHFSEYAYYLDIFSTLKDYLVISDQTLLNVTKELTLLEHAEQYEHVYQVLFATFFIRLAKLIKGEKFLVDSNVQSQTINNENVFKQRKIVEDFFQTRYAEQVGIDDLAKELCLSVPQTHRTVKKVFGIGFKKTLLRQRMEHAVMLIKQNKNGINEIAFMCGYTSYNGFLAAFKAHFNKTPKEYQKQLIT